MPADVKATVRENVRALLGLQDGESGVSKLIAQRVLGGKTSIGLDLLGELAKVLKVEPWQLCAKDLGKGAAAPAPSERWPFEDVSRDAWESLSERHKGQVELSLQEAINTIKGRSGKRQANGK